LVLVDVENCSNLLVALNQFAVVHNSTLILSWSEEEVAWYLETYRIMDGEQDQAMKCIQRKTSTYFVDQVCDVLA
jgi:Binding domain of DNA repair protein Ercc1 (rad10/Swi10)